MNDSATLSPVLGVNAYSNDYHLLRIEAPQPAGCARPGHYLTINDTAWPIMRTHAKAGWLECLQCTATPPAAADWVQTHGPLGSAFAVEQATPRALLLGGEGSVAPLVWLTGRLRQRRQRVKPFVLLTADRFPFQPRPSRIIAPGLPPWVIAAMPLLEDWNVPSRLASPAGAPGCFDGSVIELARGWLNVSQGVADVTVFACGSPELLVAAQQLAESYRLPCQTVAAVPATSGDCP